MTQPHQATSPALGGGSPVRKRRDFTEGRTDDSDSVKHQRSHNDFPKYSNSDPQPKNSEDVQRQAHVQASHEGYTKEPYSGKPSASFAAGEGQAPSARRRPSLQGPDYEIPHQWENVTELAPISPVNETSGNREELEDFRRSASQEPDIEDRQDKQSDHQAGAEPKGPRVSSAATKLYTISHLILFSLLGTLARLGLTALTTYPGSPVIFGSVWANTGGSFIMGFLAEDSQIFRHEWGAKTMQDEDRSVRPQPDEAAQAAARKAHLAVKKTIPPYIGMATGFCGSMTSFSAFIRDAFLALSNDMTVAGAPELPVHRSGGYSFMAMLAVIITTVALSLSGLIAGAHFAVAAQGFVPSLSFRATRKFIDPLVVVLGWGSWLGAILLSIFPPRDYWRQRATFSLVFAPLGCLLRFYLAVYLNGKRPSFPFGTFAANILGTVVLGMAWDVAHAEVGGVIGCQVLQGIEDGFCGCLTTISTWVAELAALRRKHAYLYGCISVVVALALLIIIMGGLRWSRGFDALLCG